jgi:RNA polymerase sigma factor (sigma-70 family)
MTPLEYLIEDQLNPPTATTRHRKDSAKFARGIATPALRRRKNRRRVNSYADPQCETHRRAVVRDTALVLSEEATRAYAIYRRQFKTMTALERFASHWHPLFFRPYSAYYFWTPDLPDNNKRAWSHVHRCSQPETVTEREAMYDVAAFGLQHTNNYDGNSTWVVDHLVALHTTPPLQYIEPEDEPSTPLTAEQRRLVDENQGLVYAVVKKFYQDYYPAARHSREPIQPLEGLLDGDDLINEGMIALCQAASRYDPSKGEFSTYAWHRIRGRLIDAIRKADRIRLPGDAGPDLKVPVYGFDVDKDGELIGGGEAPESHNPASDESLDRIDKTAATDSLTPLERDVLRRKDAGQTDREIAKLYGLTGGGIGKIRKRAVKKLSKNLSN